MTPPPPATDASVLLVLSVVPWPLRRNGMSVRFAPILEYLSRTCPVDVLVLAMEEEQIPPDWPASLSRRLSVIPVAPDRAAMSLMRKLRTAILGLLPWGIPFGGSPHVSRRAIQAAVMQQLASGHYSTVIWGSSFLDIVCRLRRQVPHLRFVVDLVDSPSLAVSRARFDTPIFRFFRLYTTWKLRRLERNLHRACDACIYISPVDAAASRTTLKHRVHVIPNGIATPEMPLSRPYPASDPPIIGFIGDMSYTPNVSAALRLANDIFPRVRQSAEDAELLIIGRNPAPEIRRLQGEHVKVTGEVPDIWAFVCRVTAFGFPMTEGAGLQNKILEAMYAGAPVVTTSIAARGLEAVHGQHLLIADSDAEIAAQLLRLLSDRKFAAELAARAAEFVTHRFAWPNLLPKYAALIAPNQPPTAWTRSRGSS